jgi:predicted MFS family arabinose efflux permease
LRVGPGFVIAVCFLLNMLGRGIGDSYAVFLLPLEREFGWSRSQLTSVYSVYLLVSGFMAPLIGLLFDRAGPRWVYGVGVACVGSAFFLAGSLGELWQFYVLIGAVVGAGSSMTGMVPASALLSRWFRGRLARAIGITFSGSGLGLVTFVPIAQALQDHYGWRHAYQVLGTGILVLLPAVAFLLPWRRIAAGMEPDSRVAGTAKQGDWTVRSAMRTRIYWGMVQAFFFTALGMFSVFIQLVAFLVASGFSAFTAAFAFGVCGMLSAGSVMGSGFLVERFGTMRTVMTAFVGSATGVALLLLVSRYPSLPLLAVFVLIFGMSLGVRGPIISSICTRHFAGSRVATIYGTVFAANSIGAATGSLIGGVLHDLTGGYTMVFVFSLCSIALASAPFWSVPALRNFR